MTIDREKARHVARETFAEAREAVEEGIRAAVPALLKAATIGVVAYVAAKATQRTVQALKWLAITGIGVHFFGAVGGLSGHALMQVGLMHIGAAAALGALSGWDTGLTARLTVGAAGIAGVAAYWPTLTASGGVALTAAVVGGIVGLVWLIDIGMYVDERL